MKTIAIQAVTLALACAGSAPALAQDYPSNNPDLRPNGTDTHPIDGDTHPIDATSRPVDSDTRVNTTDAHPAELGTRSVNPDFRLSSSDDTTTSDMDTRTWERAPRKAFEIGVNGGYTQGFGSLQGGPSTGNPTDAGFGVGVDLGYRISTKWSLQGFSQYNQFIATDMVRTRTDVRSALFGVSATFHGMPHNRIDPWLSVGSGYRLLWQMPEGVANDVFYHGFEPARLHVGLDMRASKDVALGPVVGADVNYFVWKNPENGVSGQMIADRRLSTFVFAGVQGRFDAGGHREPRFADKVVGKR